MASANYASPPARSTPAHRGSEPAEGGSDRGSIAREQLLQQATRIFAAKGFVAATTREICEAAGANIASIHYYFGDKEGLYRAALLRPIDDMKAAIGRFDDPSLTFEQAMRAFLAPFLAPSAPGAAVDGDVMRMHLREMFEPSDVFREITAQAIAPAHNALAAVLARHCGLADADADIHQLAFATVAIAHDYCMSREFMKLLAPDVLDRPQASERILDRLIGYSRALLDYEVARRGKPGTERSSR